MKLCSDSLLVGLRPFGERDFIADMFTHDFGMMSGMLRGGAVARKHKPLVGQVGAMSWNARLDSQLGVLHFESEKNLTTCLMMQPNLLGFVNSVLELTRCLLPMRESYSRLYDATIALFSGLGTDENPYDNYLKWEIIFIQELGYGLDLSRCSGCGCQENLNFISPKTGRAVCDKCAAPYMNVVYPLPLDLNITGHFLQRICEQQGTKLPGARLRLLGQ